MPVSITIGNFRIQSKSAQRINRHSFSIVFTHHACYREGIITPNSRTRATPWNLRDPGCAPPPGAREAPSVFLVELSHSKPRTYHIIYNQDVLDSNDQEQIRKDDFSHYKWIVSR